ncbi:MAG: hypothetical protein ACI9UJ_000424 [bacterium]
MQILSILNPTVFVGEFEWREPVTTLTDFLVAVVCWTAFYLFVKLKTSKSPTYVWFKNYFLVFAIGMTSAAWLGHGFQAYLFPELKLIGWICSATALMFLQMGSFKQISVHLSERLTRYLPKWFVIQWVLAITLMGYNISGGIEQAFKITQVNSVLALWGFVLPMHIYAYRKLQIQGSKIVIGALLYSTVPGVVYTNQISFSHWFNYHDISHVLMAVFMTIMFLGLYQLVKPTNP